MMNRRRYASLFAACLLSGSMLAASSAALPGVAFAQPNKVDDAKDHFMKGVELYKEADFSGALVEFKRSYEINPNFNVLSNIGQVYFQLKDYPNALKTLQQYLTEGGSRIKDSKRADTQKDIDTLKGRVATITIKVNVPGAEVFVDETSVGTSPFKEPVLISAGKRKFLATKQGYNPARDVKEFAGGDKGDLSLELTELAPGQPQPVVEIPHPNQNPYPNPNPNPYPYPQPGPGTSKPSGPSLVGPAIGFAVTGAAAIAWGVTGGLALSNDADLTTLKQHQTTASALKDQADKTKTFAIVSDAMMATTIVAAAVSTTVTIVILTKKPKRADAAQPPQVGIDIGPTALGLQGAF